MSHRERISAPSSCGRKKRAWPRRRDALGAVVARAQLRAQGLRRRFFVRGPATGVRPCSGRSRSGGRRGCCRASRGRACRRAPAQPLELVLDERVHRVQDSARTAASRPFAPARCGARASSRAVPPVHLLPGAVAPPARAILEQGGEEGQQERLGLARARTAVITTCLSSASRLSAFLVRRGCLGQQAADGQLGQVGRAPAVRQDSARSWATFAYGAMRFDPRLARSSSSRVGASWRPCSTSVVPD